MKKNCIFILFLISASICYSQIGAFKVTNSSAIQLGYQNYRWLGFGFQSSSTSNSQWAIEHWDGGLNFWKPWPSANAGNYKMFLHDEGFVGINMKPNPGATISVPYSCGALGLWTCWRTVGNFRLQVNGNIASYGHYTWSDSSIKKNVSNMTNSLEAILKLRPVKYNYTDEAVNMNRENQLTSSEDEIKNLTIQADSPKTIKSNEPKHMGLIAQEVARIFPEIVSPVGVTQAINYTELIPVLVGSIQEQQVIIDSLNLQIQNLRQEIVNWKGQTLDSPEDKTRLFQNNPNPFEGSTTFSYYIDESTTVTNAVIEIRNIMGNLITTLTLGDQSGIGSISYNGSSLNQGYYVFALKINGSVKDSKMFLKE